MLGLQKDTAGAVCFVVFVGMEAGRMVEATMRNAVGLIAGCGSGQVGDWGGDADGYDNLNGMMRMI